jgi:hypothetical protein
MAKRAKTSTGWFFGFKLHLIINDRGEILAFKLTPREFRISLSSQLLNENHFFNRVLLKPKF